MHIEFVDFCINQTCQNGGTCLNLEKDYMCMCTTEFRGKNCAESKAPCYMHVCYLLWMNSITFFLLLTGNLFPVAPTIIKGPRNQFVEIFDEVKLTCNSIGFPPPSIKWFKDGEVLEGQRSQTLLIQEAQLRDRGFYHCEAINSVDMVLSRRAVVTFTSECNTQC